jgi:hypothetical protein
VGITLRGSRGIYLWGEGVTLLRVGTLGGLVSLVSLSGARYTCVSIRYRVEGGQV